MWTIIYKTDKQQGKLYNTGNYIRYIVVTYKGRESKSMYTFSGPITSWQIDGETMETVTHFIFLDSKVTADGDCSHEIKRPLLLGRKAMTNLDSI